MGEAKTKKLPRPNHMCVNNTPVEHYPELGLYVKREDLCCPSGPHFSKTRGVYAHVAERPEEIIGVLDTAHSQGGWAVAAACKLLNKHCVVYYPVRKADQDTTIGWDPIGKGLWGDVLKPQQIAAQELGASLLPLQAGRSAVLYHQAKKDLWDETELGSSYMMPNALKLPEMVSETVAEFRRTKLPDVSTILVSASSATIAAGVILGAELSDWEGTIIVHMGYSRPDAAVRNYIRKMTGIGELIQKVSVRIVDEGYAYADVAKPGPAPSFPCNEFYDLKAFRWWLKTGRYTYHKRALFWNIG